MARTGPDQKLHANDRKARLAEELRANLARRKAQARSRKTGSSGEVLESEEANAAEAGDDER